MNATTWANIDKSRFFFWGGVFTLAVDCLLYPLELIKTRVQVETGSRATLLAASRRAATDVYTREGFRGLYRGFTLFTLGGLPSQGMYFWGFGAARAALIDINNERHEDSRVSLFYIDCAAGGIADMLAAPLWVPAEVLSTRMQVQGPGVTKTATTLDAARAVWASEGFRGFFRGLSASVLAFGPASALWWGVYGSSHRFLETQEAYIPSIMADAMSGFAAGVISSIVTNPLEIAKTRLQVQHALITDFAVDDTGKRIAREYAFTTAANADIANIAAITANNNALLAARKQYDAVKRNTPTKRVKKNTTTRQALMGGGVVFEVERINRLRIRLAVNAIRRDTLPSSIAFIRAHAAVAAAASSIPLPTTTSHIKMLLMGNSEGSVMVARAAVAAAREGLDSLLGGNPSSSSSSNSSSSSSSSDSSGKSGRGVQRGNAAMASRAIAVSAARAAASARIAAIAAASAANTNNPPKLFSGVTSMMKHIVATEGLSALVRGLVPRILLNGPASALTFVAYEEVLRLSTIRKDLS